MPATFKVGRGDSPVDACSECYRVSDVTVAEQVCCRVAIVALPAGVSVAVLAAGFPGAVILSAAATVYTATGARAASAILKRSSRKKVADFALIIYAHAFTSTPIFYSYLVLMVFLPSSFLLTLIFPEFFLFFFVANLSYSCIVMFSAGVYDHDGKISCTYRSTRCTR